MVSADGGPESFGEFGCIQHSGTLDKTQVPFDLYVKVRALASVCECSLSRGQLSELLSFLSWLGAIGRKHTTTGLCGKQ